MPITNNNRLSKTLIQAEIDALRGAFNTIETTLPWLVGLTISEKVALPKMNDSNKTFTEDAQTGLSINADIFPAYLKADEMGKDVTLFNQLEEFVQRSSKLCEKLSDTQTLAGSEAYITALAVYRLAESAAIAGIPGADTLYKQLKQRFAGQGNPGTTPPPAEPTK
jgi:hypothetical protein